MRYFCAKKLTPLLLSIVLLLTALNIVAILLAPPWEAQNVDRTQNGSHISDEHPVDLEFRGGVRGEITESFVRLFLFENEANIPTWFSSVLLLVAAALLWVIAVKTDAQGMRFTTHWQALALIFVYLSLDESAVIHEMAIKPVGSALHARGFFLYAWVIPAIPVLLILLMLYGKFLFALDSRTRLYFLVAGFLYVLGAMGIEMCSAYVADTFGLHNLMYVVLATLEDFFEMIGLVLFIHALQRYLCLRFYRSAT